MRIKETIAAIATAVVPRQGSVGIVRISGEKAVQIARKLFSAPGKQLWESHRILYGYIRHPQSKQIVDEALLLLMLAPRSYTREDVVEFHAHGGIISVQQVLQLCLEEGAVLARPGEFTLRAFLNGRLDLTQAESVAELVGAGSRQAARIALAGLEGKLAHPIKNLRATCLDILAEIEARIDFEEDLPPLDEETVSQNLQDVLASIERILATAERGELLRSGLKVAIVGRPNVGKSSLLNAWSQSDRAIVTELPGTTRDIVESHLVVDGIPVRVLDTAGIRETPDVIEKIGIDRSRRAALGADSILLMIDASEGWTEEDEEIYGYLEQRPVILVINKIDLVPPESVTYPERITKVVYTAASKNQGIDSLERAIVESVRAGDILADELEIAVNQRQAAALSNAKASLERVRQTLEEELPLDFWTIDLRSAIVALGEITGEEITESMLEKIFSRFCIGK